MTCICGASIAADTYLCPTCAGRLDQHLGNVPAWIDELETTMTGEKSQTFIARGSAAMQTLTKPENDKGDEESPLHYNERAADIKRQLVTELATMQRAFIRAPGTPAEMSRALLCTDLRTFPDSPTWLRRLDRISDRVEHIIDVTAPKQYLGTCTSMDSGDVCGGEIYAAVGAPEGTCDSCPKRYDAAASRQILEDALDSRLYTAKEIAGLSTYLGLRDSRERVEKRVNTWHRRGLILAHAHTDTGEPMFTYGDVRNRLATLEQA